jgi:hypothetical protein
LVFIPVSFSYSKLEYNSTAHIPACSDQTKEDRIVGYAGHTRGSRNTQKVLFRKPEEKGLLGSPMNNLKNNIKSGLKEKADTDRIYLT